MSSLHFPDTVLNTHRHPINGYWRTAPSTSLSTFCPPEAEERMKIPLSFLFFKLDKAMVLSGSLWDIPSSHLTNFVALLWDTFKYLHILLKSWSPEPHTVLQMRPQECLIQQNNHLLWLESDNINYSFNSVGKNYFCLKGLLLEAFCYFKTVWLCFYICLQHCIYQERNKHLRSIHNTRMLTKNSPNLEKLWEGQ